MNSLIKRTLPLFVITSLTLGCASSNVNSSYSNQAVQNKIIGLWTNQDKRSNSFMDLLELKNDGTGITNNNNENIRFSIKYTISNSQIIFQFRYFLVPFTVIGDYEFIDNNTMVLNLSIREKFVSDRIALPDTIVYRKGIILQNGISNNEPDIVWNVTDQTDNVNNELDIAFKSAVIVIMPSLQKDSIIALVNMSSSDSEVDEFISGELELFLINNGFVVVDRSQLDRIRQEQNFQLSGEVDDNFIVSIGKFLGANIVITNSVTGSGNMRRLRFRVLDTQTARVLGVASEAF